MFAPFVQERPIGVMARGVWERLHDAQRIEALWARPAEPQSPRAWLFSSLGQLMRAGVLGVQPSVQAASQAHQETIGGSTTARDHTLERVETGGAAAWVRDAARVAEPVLQARRARQPRW